MPPHKIKLQSIIVFLILNMVQSSDAVDPNRMLITGPRSANTRCADQPLPADERSGARMGCINQREFDKLVEYSSAPSCVVLPGREPRLIAWSVCGCFHQDTPIAVRGPVERTPYYIRAIDLISNPRNLHVYSLAPKATLKKVELNVNSIGQVTKGFESSPLTVIKKAQGRIIRVTGKHPVLTAHGKMIQAGRLKEGDVIATAIGSSDTIAKISLELTNKPVVNFAVNAKTSQEHIVVANSILVGDLFWQSSLEDLKDSLQIRQ